MSPPPWATPGASPPRTYEELLRVIDPRYILQEPRCSHGRLTTKGSNQHQRVVKCKLCGQLLALYKCKDA